MRKYLVERDIPGLGNTTPEEFVAIAQRSNTVLAGYEGRVQWIQSYVTGDKMTCVYLAPNADLVREHATRGGFPAHRVEEVLFIVDPQTAGGALWAASAVNAVPVGAAL
jgi:hypothetical protein